MNQKEDETCSIIFKFQFRSFRCRPLWILEICMQTRLSSHFLYQFPFSFQVAPVSATSWIASSLQHIAFPFTRPRYEGKRSHPNSWSSSFFFIILLHLLEHHFQPCSSGMGRPCDRCVNSGSSATVRCKGVIQNNTATTNWFVDLVVKNEFRTSVHFAH